MLSFAGNFFFINRIYSIAKNKKIIKEGHLKNFLSNPMLEIILQFVGREGAKFFAFFGGQKLPPAGYFFFLFQPPRGDFRGHGVFRKEVNFTLFFKQLLEWGWELGFPFLICLWGKIIFFRFFPQLWEKNVIGFFPPPHWGLLFFAVEFANGCKNPPYCF